MDSSHLRVGVHSPPLGNTAHCFYNTIPCYAILGCRRFVIHFTERSGRGGWGSGSWKADTSFGEMCNRGLVWKRCNEGFRFVINVIVILLFFCMYPGLSFRTLALGNFYFKIDDLWSVRWVCAMAFPVQYSLVHSIVVSDCLSFT